MKRNAFAGNIFKQQFQVQDTGGIQIAGNPKVVRPIELNSVVAQPYL